MCGSAVRLCDNEVKQTIDQRREVYLRVRITYEMEYSKLLHRM